MREGVRRWAEGDLRALGELVERSGRSSIELYECGCAEMNAIVGILNRDAECLGARASGGAEDEAVAAMNWGPWGPWGPWGTTS